MRLYPILMFEMKQPMQHKSKVYTPSVNYVYLKNTSDLLNTSLAL